MNKNVKYVLWILAFLLVLLIAFNPPGNMKGRVDEITYSQFLNMLKSKPGQEPIGEIVTESGKSPLKKQLIIEREQIEGWYKPKGSEKVIRFKTIIAPIHTDLTQKLLESNIEFQAKSNEENRFISILMNIIPWILVILVIWFIMIRQLQSTGNKAFSFGKSRAKMNADTKVKVTFNDVAGCDEAKHELTEMIDFLKDPKKFQAIGARIPKGVLLVGPPGTGKTLLAKAVAGEAGVPFLNISGSDFVEMFVGVGASRVRDLFDQGKKHAPCIIFIDEIDAVGRLRGAGLGGGHDEREQTLNQMLVEMDGFEPNESIIVIAATNRADVLDPALLRPGRFDRQVVVDLPDVKGREEILKVHTKKVPLTSDISLESIARGTPGFTGADLANLVNEAALLSARKNKKRVTQEELEEARDKVMMGPERRSFFITEKEKEVIAYHEAGHAILATLLEHTEPIHKVTIIPRGRALGLTQSLPEEEKHIHPKHYWLDQITMAMGGYIAEDYFFGNPSTGSSNDILQATNIARRMVCDWGMSDKLGTVNYNSSHDQVFLGRDMYGGNKFYSEEFAAMIDEEVKSIIDSSLNRGRTLIKDNKEMLKELASLLLSKETVTREELENIVEKLSSSPPPPKATKKRATKKKVATS
ncbi:MAG: ATP-dependent metallopeptidase FtsH/Yme1/Tma family protein [Leptospiraceae bacterium]|nr:ATP-dependent zinc metalloprotease FtsH [Leptospiraceae bacterium]MCP5502222.1 ATP-dependent metallopeptidase FtsH/Yme1/Tma family protein [Leptospiraceae bacterium]